MALFQPNIWHQELEFPYKALSMFCSNHFTCKQLYCVLPDELVFPSMFEQMQYALLKQRRFFRIFDALKPNVTIDVELLTEIPVLFLFNIQAWQNSLSLQAILEKRSSRGMQTFLTSNQPIDLLLIIHSNRTIERLLKDSMVIFFPSGASLTFNLFVYGTLKKGFSNHHYLKNATFLGAAKTAVPYPMILKHKAFPYLIDKPNKGLYIQGELYKVDYQTLLILDELEGYPSHYTRHEIDIIQEDNQTQRAVAYFLNEKINYKKYSCLAVFENEFLTHLSDADL